jgi:hypothetical protein
VTLKAPLPERSTLHGGEQKVQEGSLRPMACVARLEREKGAVAAMPGLDQHDAGVGDQFGASVGSHADEGVVKSVQDQRGRGDVLGPVGAGNAVVVVVRASEAAVSRDIVNRWLRTSAGCQWQWHSTKLAPREVAGSTSMSWLSGSGREYVRGMRLPTMVCRWALRRKRGGTKGRIHGEASVVSNRSSVVPIRVPIFTYGCF